MNKDRLREEIAEDEGCKYEIYLDHLALPTCGVGHLITEHDEEYGKPVGTVVEQERVRSLFALDIAVTIDECKVLYSDFDDFDEDYYEMIKPTYELDTDDRVFYDKVGKYFQIRMIFKLAGFKFIK